ncbi:OpgC domain-containing protein [Sabulicella rubraurantiaca]|uniref:OpgC domain-containing protein n=1 Tax=Sabulicella rubraurantiaca TaxID=2811429 RepID=UPI001A964C3D|nr:OpgC domain-containing protein [Sabulicella rubraurantiaca]
MAAAPHPPSRDPALDAVRGWLQISIFASHIASGAAGATLIHAAWGLSDSSEQFVFLSGFGLGSVFLWKAARAGRAAALADLRARAGRLWRMHMLVFLGFGSMVAALAPLSGEPPWAWAMERPLAALAAGATGLYQPPFMGILPLFLFGMASLPLFSALADRWGERTALLLPAGLYALGQALPPDLPAMGGTSFAFQPPAWVALFLLGAWCGRRALRAGRVLPRHGALLLGAGAVVALGLAMRLSGWTPEVLVGKEQLAPLRLLHALSCAYFVAALLPKLQPVTATGVGRALTTIGRRSLEVFSLGLFLSWLAGLALRHAPGMEIWVEAPLLALGVAAFWAVARGLERGGSARPAPGAARAEAG